MATPKDTLWEIEPHTQAKHEILRRYLGAWFPILGRYDKALIYIDGFCGPGRYSGGEDGSPIIALHQAISHIQRLKNNNLLFLFIDDRKDRIAHLTNELNNFTIPNNFSTQIIHGAFEDTFRNLLDSIENKGLQIAPTFVFIDPFGFKGIPLDLVCRLLQNPKTEVFINFMVDAINRFLTHPDDKTKQHFVSQFGTDKVLKIAKTPGDRITALRLLYQEQLKNCADFVRYFEMRDNNNRPIYYLFHATNHPLGHLKMKGAFWKVDPTSGFSFSDATNPYQLVLFGDSLEVLSLTETIRTHFAGQTVTAEKIRVFVENETSFLPTHMKKKALPPLESNGAITVREIKTDGKKRLRNTYPDEAIIEFTPK